MRWSWKEFKEVNQIWLMAIYCIPYTVTATFLAHLSTGKQGNKSLGGKSEGGHIDTTACRTHSHQEVRRLDILMDEIERIKDGEQTGLPASTPSSVRKADRSS